MMDLLKTSIETEGYKVLSKTAMIKAAGLIEWSVGRHTVEGGAHSALKVDRSLILV